MAAETVLMAAEARMEGRVEVKVDARVMTVGAAQFLWHLHWSADAGSSDR